MLSSALLALAAPHALPAEDLTQLSLEQLLDVPVYSASKFVQKASDAPSAVTVVTREEIGQYGWRTLADVLRAVPGFYVFYDRIYEYAGVRGFGRLGDFNSRLLVLVDGYRTNDVIYDTGYIGTEMVLDLDLVERIEIVRGPGSSIYGSNALFGVVNIVTRSGASVDGAELAMGASSHKTGHGRATIGRKLEGNGADFLLSVSRTSSDGSRVCDSQYATDGNDGGCTSGTDFDDSSRAFGKLAIGGLTLTAAASRREKGIPFPYSGAVFDDPAGRQIDAQSYFNAEYRHGFSAGTEFTGRLYYGDYFGAGRLNFAGDSGTALNIDSARGKWWGTELKLVSQLGARNKLVAGIEYVDVFSQVQYQYDEDPFFVYLDSRPSSNRLGIYAQDEFQWTDSLKLVAGARWDKYSELDAQFNPRFALVWKPTDSTVAKLMYGSAFRAANVYERFYALEGNSIENPLLEPERIETYEAVFEHYLDRQTRLTAAAYYYQVDKLINQVPVEVATDVDGESQTLLQFQNVPGVSSLGVDLVGERRWDSGARLRAALDYQSSEDSEGRTLSNSPRWMAKLLGAVPLPWWGLELGGEAQWMSERKTDLDRNVGSYGSVNLTLWKPRLKSNWEASVSVYNLFDRQYDDPVLIDPEALPDRDRTGQDGRSYRFKLVYHF